MKRKQEMTNAERIAVYPKAVGYLGYIMCVPRYRTSARQKLPLRMDLESYFACAADMDKAFEVICGRMVIVDKNELTHEKEPEAAKLWAAFTDTKGLASYDVLGYSEADIAGMYRDCAYLHMGVPLFAQYWISYMMEPSKGLRKQMKKAMMNAGLKRADVGYFTNLGLCLEETYAMQPKVIHESIVMDGRVAA